MLKKIICIGSILLSGFSSTSVFAENKADVLVLYDGFAESFLSNQVEIKMEQWISDSNDILTNSGVDLQLNLVGVVEFDPNGAYYPTALREITNSSAVRDIRDNHGADFVVQLAQTRGVVVASSGSYGDYLDTDVRWQQYTPGVAPVKSTLTIAGYSVVTEFWNGQCEFRPVNGFRVEGTSCTNFKVTHESNNGGAWLTLDAEKAYSIVDPRAGVLAFIHELGHNMGLHHEVGTNSNSSGVAYRYGRGYEIPGSFATVMAYNRSYGINGRLAMFSTPNETCNGVPCGVHAGHADEADSVRAINNKVNTIVNYRQSSTPSTPPVNTCDAACPPHLPWVELMMCRSSSPACM